MHTRLLTITCSLVLGILIIACSGKTRHAETLTQYECSSKSLECVKSKSGVMARPALPDSTVKNLSEKLEYILDTDHEDRMNGTVIFDMSRDSLRLSQVMEWYEAGLIKNWNDKYRAAFIFIHKGGPLMGEDQKYLRIAHELFSEVAGETTDPAIREESINLSASALEAYLSRMLWEEMAMRMARQQPGNAAGA